MKPAKEMFELSLHLHRRLEGLTAVEKATVMALLNVMLQAELQETQQAIAEQQRNYQRLQQSAAIADEYQT